MIINNIIYIGKIKFFITLMRFFIVFCFLMLSKPLFADILLPSPSLLPEEVVTIQLDALKNNNIPYVNAGIEQAWEFAHPSNRKFTGPLDNFKNMLLSPAYSLMLNFQEYKIIPVKKNEYQSLFFIELKDKNGIMIGFQWIVEKVQKNGKYNNCWMTISVSQPIYLSKSA